MKRFHSKQFYVLRDNFISYQSQASDQFLATTKLATNKAICLKTKTISKSKMYF